MDEIHAGLRAFADPPAWLTASADGERILAAVRREVPAACNGTVEVLACDVEDLRLKDGAWTGRYVLTIEDAAGQRSRLPLTGLLSGEGRRAESPSTDAAFGSADWAGTLTDPQLALRTSGGDRRLRALPLLTAPEPARDLIEDALRARFHGIRVAACTPEVVRYRPGQRCTVCCHLSYGAGASPSWPRLVVAKVHRAGEGAHGHGALEVLARAGLGELGVDIAEPLSYLPRLDVSVQSHLPQDRSLTGLVGEAADGAEPAMLEAQDALRSVAEALSTLHRTHVRYGVLHTIEDEVAAARSGLHKLAAVFPQLGPALEPLLRLVEERAAATPPDAVRPAHGAFRPAQVRLHRERVGLLDLDGFGLSEPAQDVGRFVAKLRLVSLRGEASLAGPDRMTAADRLATAFLAEYGQHSSVSPVRVSLWETLDLVKTLLQCWSRVRPDQLPFVLALLDARLADLQAPQDPAMTA